MRIFEVLKEYSNIGILMIVNEFPSYDRSGLINHILEHEIITNIRKIRKFGNLMF